MNELINIQAYFNNAIATRYLASIGEKVIAQQKKIAIIASVIITLFSTIYLLYKRYNFKAEVKDSNQTELETEGDRSSSPKSILAIALMNKEELKGPVINPIESEENRPEFESALPAELSSQQTLPFVPQSLTPSVIEERNLDSSDTPLTLIQEYKDGFTDFYTLIKKDEEGTPPLLRRMETLLSENTSSSDVSFDKLRICSDQFKALLNKLEELKFKPLQMDDQGRIPIPDRGNCFFEAIVAGFKVYNCSQELWDTTHEELRLEIVRLGPQLLSNDPLYRFVIESTIMEYLQDMDQSIADEESTCEYIKNELNQSDTNLRTKINNDKQRLEPLRQFDEDGGISQNAIDYYLNLVGSEGFWAGASEVFAANALLKQMNIGLTVISDAFTHEYSPELTNRITIQYDGHHYELQTNRN